MTDNKSLAAAWPRGFLHTAPPEPRGPGAPGRGSSLQQMVPGSQEDPRQSLRAADALEPGTKG